MRDDRRDYGLLKWKFMHGKQIKVDDNYNWLQSDPTHSKVEIALLRYVRQ
jgi:hypothetical protein